MTYECKPQKNGGVIGYDGQYRNRRVLLAGHTGFKGSWLALWLQNWGAHVSGTARAPEYSPNHWDLLKLVMPARRQDIRDFVAFSQILNSERLEIVFHLAVQPLVRRSYRQSLKTWSTNLIGTTNPLKSSRLYDSVRAIVVITRDKCYENQEWPWGYREHDRLGSHDPYSATKAACELLVNSYRRSFFQQDDSPLLATASVGNVIGGCSWSEDRLNPDLVRAMAQRQPLEIRSPQVTSPLQHVLESLNAYLLLGQRFAPDAWNFDHDTDSNLSVSKILHGLKGNWPTLDWCLNSEQQVHETNLLYLDSAKVRQKLDWRPVWSLHKTLSATAAWYQHHAQTGQILSELQLQNYQQAAYQPELIGSPSC